MRIVSSPLALDVLLALSQRRDGASLSEIARAVDAPLPSVQVAVRLLVEDGLLSKDRQRRPRYRTSAGHRASDALLALAARAADPSRAIDVTVRANPSIEFAARDRRGYLLVESPLADPRDVLLLDQGLARINGAILLERTSHADVVHCLREDPALRERARRATIIKGRLARSFPVPRRRSGNQRLQLPSRRAISRLARAAGLSRIRVFGSAARGTMHESSDVDVVVEPLADRDLTLLDLAELEGALEELFDRHVDVVTPDALRDDIRRRVERDAVILYG